MSYSEEILKLIDELKTDREKELFIKTTEIISSQYKSAAKVRNTTKSALKPFKQGHRKKMFSSVEVEQMREYKKRGISNRRIAKIFKCSKTTVSRYLDGFADN